MLLSIKRVSKGLERNHNAFPRDLLEKNLEEGGAPSLLVRLFSEVKGRVNAGGTQLRDSYSPGGREGEGVTLLFLL